MRRPILAPLLLPLLLLPEGSAARGVDVDAMQYGPCPSMSVHGYTIELGYASGKDEAAALGEAREDAYQKLLDRAAAGYSEMRRASIGRHIVPWLEGEYDKKSRSACAAVAISEEWLGTLERDLDALEGSIAALAAAARAQSGGAPLQLVPPVWTSSGCSAGELGAHVQNTLEANLGGAQLVDRGDAIDGMRQLRVGLSSSGGQIRLSAALRGDGEVAWTGLELEPMSFPRDLFEIVEGEDGACASGERLGLADGHRAGDDGLWARIEVPPPLRGIYCEGETFTPAVALSGPAQLRIYAVEADGEGYMVWSSQGRALSWLALKDEPVFAYPWTVTRADDGGDVQLVIAAASAGADFGAGEPEGHMCRLQQPLHASRFSDAVSLHTVSYQVADGESRLCADRGDPDAAAASRAQAEQTLARFSEAWCP